MQLTRLVLPASVLALTLPASANAQETPRSERPLPIFVSTDVLLECKVVSADGPEGKIDDAIVDVSSGRLVDLVLESGVVLEFDRVEWNSVDGVFDHESTKPVGAASPVDASSPRAQGTRSDAAECYLLSRVARFPIRGQERSADGTRRSVDLGSAGGGFVDVRSGHLAFVSTSVGGVLGIGAESRAIPWGAFELRCDDEGAPELRTTLSPRRLDRAPRVGDGRDKIGNPEYRDTLYSYFGTRRASFEPEAADRVTLVPIAELLGEPIRRIDDDDDRVDDFVLDRESGRVALVVCRSGRVLPVESVAWVTSDDCFRVREDGTEEHSGDRDSHVLASALVDVDLLREGEECGSVDCVYLDARTFEIRYVAVERDGVRVLPWSVVAVESSGDEARLELSCSTEALDSAPELDGLHGASIHSRAFRERVEELASEPGS